MSGGEVSRLSRWPQRAPWPTVSACSPYALLIVLAAIALPWHSADRAALPAGLSLCALDAGWMLFMWRLHPAWRTRVPHVVVFVVGLQLITLALVLWEAFALGSGWFGFLAAVCFAYTRALARLSWRLAGAAGVAFIAACSQTAGLNSSELFHVTVGIVALTVDLLLMGSLMWLLWEHEQQAARNQRALAELEAANRRLEATIAENEGLHRQLLANAREAGVLDERRRMAREIHDTLAQGLTGIVTQLQAAERAAERTPADPVGWRRHVAAATRLARDSLTEARRSVDALRPEPLEGCRLSEALAGVAERWSALNGVPAQVTTTGTARPIHAEAEFALLRAAQEALANVARHAHATRVGLTISFMENEVALDVRDDGVGFDLAALDHGFGLVAMRQRIAHLSGSLQVESEPGGGTAVSACVPTAATAITAASLVSS
jgi:signal transduction histidine kinase